MPRPNRRQHSRNFVLCPGLAYDRSPCGTGTSAKLACLFADGKLQPGEVWRQESVIGTLFEASFTVDEHHRDRVLPHITGEAYVTGESTLIFDDADPLALGHRRPNVSKHVLIVGGGIVGLSVAYYCSRKGHRVTLLERRGRKSRRLFLRQCRHARAKPHRSSGQSRHGPTRIALDVGIPRARFTSSRV